MTQVDFIPALLPDGSLPAESQAFVSQQVQQEAGQFVTDAQAAQSAAEAARDTATRASAEALRALPGVKRSTNLLSMEDATLGHMLTPDGEITPIHNWHVSGFIPVAGGATYTGRLSGSGIGRFAAYDADRNFLHTRNDISTYTTPPETAFLRVNVHKDLAEPQLNAGPDLLPYEPYWVRIPGLGLSVDPADTTFVRLSSNLFDKDAVTEGLVYPASSGTPTPNPYYCVSAPIRVQGGGIYAKYGLLRVSFFTADDDFISSTDTESPTFTAPTNATTARLSIHISNWLDVAQLNAGPDLLPYEPYWVEVAGRRIHTESGGGDGGDGGGLTPGTDRLLIDNPAGLDQDYAAPEIPDYLDLHSTLTSDVYDWYDALTADHPDYITRSTIGVGSDDTPIHSYTLTTPPVPTHPSGTSPIVIPKPAILLISGVHGYEKAAVRVLYEIARALCEDWANEPVLDALRSGFDIVIVPVANPYSYDGSSSGTNQRGNANGVDIARNFTEGWSLGDPAADTYGGPAPLSEPETVALDTLMQELASRCVLGASLHNFSASESGPEKMIWNASPSPLQVRLGTQVVSRVSRRWRTRHAWITVPEPYFGYSDLGAPGGSESRQMLAHGINGSTFEVSRICRLAGAGTTHDSRALTLGMEATVTYIAMGAKLGLDLLNRR